MNELIEIDGSYGEAGGQVLRTALTLSTLTGRPTRLVNIRAGRKNPGLAPQHLTGVLALAKICNAEVQGAALESTELVFTPRSRPRSGDYTFDVTRAAKKGSAGSVTLIFQTLGVSLAFAASPSNITLKGGTHVPWSPPFEYLKEVYLPIVARMGVKAECRLDAWGFYPRGAGQLTATVHPLTGPDSRLTAITLLERGELKRIKGTAVACNLQSRIAQKMANRANNILKSAGLKADITPRRERGVGPGAYFFITTEYEKCRAGFSALGRPGKTSEHVAEEVCHDLLEYHREGAPVDAYLADQLLLPMALAGGRSEIRTGRISKHLLTVAHVIEHFVPAHIMIARDARSPERISIEENEEKPGVVTVEGAADF
jgi:RNA 3'-terminal phosphate cyclase (ATP)